MSIKQLAPALRAALALKDQSIRSWATQKGFRPKTVYSALHGRFKGLRGVEAKKILAAARAEVRRADFARLGIHN